MTQNAGNVCPLRQKKTKHRAAVIGELDIALAGFVLMGLGGALGNVKT